MRITDLLDKRSISLNETPKTKSEALDRIIDLMVASGESTTVRRQRTSITAKAPQESEGVTTIPHGKYDAVTETRSY